MAKIKDFIKRKIANQAAYYIDNHKEEIARDFFYNTSLKDGSDETLEKEIVHLKERIDWLEREHGRRQWEHVWYNYSIWWTEGAADRLIEEYEYKERFHDFWEDEQPEYWMIYIACLLDRGQKAKAIDIVKKFDRYYGVEEVYKVMPTAALFDELGLKTDENIKKSSKMREVLLQRQKDKLLDKYLNEAKSIAIVGNSRREVGKGLGDEIDSHDIVIRLNDSILKDEQRTVEDYGKKCDIWARGGGGDQLTTVRDITGDDLPEFVVYCDDYEHGFIHSNELFELFYNDVFSDEYMTCTMSPESHFELREKSNLINPTSGAYIVWYVYQVLGSLEDVDIYGFSFLDLELKETDYEGVGGFEGQHYMDREMRFLYDLKYRRL